MIHEGASRTTVCQICGTKFDTPTEWEKLIKLPTISKGVNRYVCPTCWEVLKTSEGVAVGEMHEGKVHGLEVAYVFNAKAKDENGTRLLQTNTYQMQIRKNSHGLKIHTPIYKSRNGLKQILETVNKSVQLKGHQIIEVIDTKQEVGFTDSMVKAITETLKKSRYSLREVKIFDNIITFKMNFENVEQLKTAVFLIDDLIKVVNTNYIPYKGTDKEERKEGLTIQRLISKAESYRNGTANCQRPERMAK